ncbi:MAG: chorismate-binding protein, partial [Candidatus Binatia bacterium]
MTAYFVPDGFLRRLGELLTTARGEADRHGFPVLVSATTAIPSIDPAALFGRLPDGERVLWEQPSQEFSLVGVGVAARLTGCGAQRFTQVSAAWDALRSRSVVDTPPACPLPGPVGLSGFTFDPARRTDRVWESYPDALLLVPRFLVLSCAGTTWLMVNIQVAPGDDTTAVVEGVADEWQNLLLALTNPPALCAPPFMKGGQGGFVDGDNVAQAEEWKGTVAAILRDIRAGQVEKVVLARQVRVRLSRSVDLEALVRRLRTGYGNCTVFAFARHGRCFVGATPERLVGLD